MAKLPITESVSRTINQDGTVAVTAAWTDGNGAQVLSVTHTFPADTPPLAVIAQLRQQAHGVLAGYLGWADLPASYSTQIGLDTSLRNLDLL